MPIDDPAVPETTMPPHEEITDLDFGCDTWPLHYACRIGNLDHATYLIDVMQADVNEPDAFDNTPLYLAALTGHDEICRLLLERGARCDPDSGGDAARVFYVALTPELRRLLREWSLSAAARDPFLDGLKASFNNSTYTDIELELPDGSRVYLHSVLLRLRCPKLLPQVMADGPPPLCHRIESKHSSKELMFILEYLYTGVYETTDVEQALLVREAATDLGLDSLAAGIAESLEETGKFRVTLSHTDQLRSDMRRLARRVAKPHAEYDSLSALATTIASSDAAIICEDATWSLHLFRLSQSEYLERAFSGGFLEASLARLDVSSMVGEAAMRLAIEWMYCDEFLSEVSLEAAVEVLELGYSILCPRLSQHVVTCHLVPAVDPENVVDLLEVARGYDLERLEIQCATVIGEHLQHFVADGSLHRILRGEANRFVQAGDETVADIPFAAEIRRALRQQTNETESRLVILQSVVDKVRREIQAETSSRL